MSEPTESAEAPTEDDSPAGPPARPRARERGRMRRRLRQQRGMREALLVDLGALVFELHRHGRREPELLQAKAAELTAVDNEVRALSEALDQDLGLVELVAAGIAGTCPECKSLMSIDARFCATCGLGTEPGLEARAPAEAGAIETTSEAPDEQLLAADLADEPEALADPETEIVAEPEADFDAGDEPEPPSGAEPEPEPEPIYEPRPTSAPWLGREEEPPPPRPPMPEPVRVPRRQSRLERALRGRRK